MKGAAEKQPLTIGITNPGSQLVSQALFSQCFGHTQSLAIRREDVNSFKAALLHCGNLRNVGGARKSPSVPAELLPWEAGQEPMAKDPPGQTGGHSGLQEGLQRRETGTGRDALHPRPCLSNPWPQASSLDLSRTVVVSSCDLRTRAILSLLASYAGSGPSSGHSGASSSAGSPGLPCHRHVNVVCVNSGACAEGRAKTGEACKLITRQS